MLPPEKAELLLFIEFQHLMHQSWHSTDSSNIRAAIFHFLWKILRKWEFFSISKAQHRKAITTSFVINTHSTQLRHYLMTKMLWWQLWWITMSLTPMKRSLWLSGLFPSLFFRKTGAFSFINALSHSIDLWLERQKMRCKSMFSTPVCACFYCVEPPVFRHSISPTLPCCPCSGN